MNLRASVGLSAAVEEKVEMEGDRKRFPELRSAKKKKVDSAGGGAGSGWQYGFRHPVGFIPQRTLSGFPKVGRGGGRSKTAGAPSIPKAQNPGPSRRPNPSMGRATKGPGHFRPNPSLSRLSTAGTRTGRQEIAPVKARAGGSGAKDVGIQTPHKVTGDLPHLKKAMTEQGAHKKRHWGIDKLKRKQGRLLKKKKAGIEYDAKEMAGGKFPTEGTEPPQTGAYSARRTPKDKFFEESPKGKITADGEPSDTMQHAHIQPLNTFHPPSLVKRGKQTHVPVDDPGETDDKYMDVTKRNSQQTHEEKMKLLKRQPPPDGRVPAHTTLIPEHSGVYLPSSMMSAERKFKSRPVNWDKQPRNRTSYARRGCI